MQHYRWGNKTNLLSERWGGASMGFFREMRCHLEQELNKFRGYKYMNRTELSGRTVSCFGLAVRLQWSVTEVDGSQSVRFRLRLNFLFTNCGSMDTVSCLCTATINETLKWLSILMPPKSFSGGDSVCSVRLAPSPPYLLGFPGPCQLVYRESGTR